MGGNTKILVVDDDFGIGNMLRMLLAKEGYHIIVCQEPDEIEAIMKKNKIDLILLDKLLAGVCGADVCADLKKDENTKHIPIIMMSALHDVEMNCKAAGADGFIAKPFSRKVLLAKIRSILNNE